MTLLIPALLVVSFFISVVFTAAMKRIAPQLDFVDKPGPRKTHYLPKPLGGGGAIFCAVVFPMAAGLIVANTVNILPTRGEPPTAWQRARQAYIIHQPGLQQQTPLAMKFLVAAAAMHILGLIDDRRSLGPYLKLVIQLGIITALVLWAELRAITALDHLGIGKAPSMALTVLWIAAITNAFNFLDNMDGLSAGVAAVAAAAFLVTTLAIGQWFVAAMLALLLGALLGFLCFNFPPATIFMGDSGSLFVGLVLGVLTVRTTYLNKPLAEGWYEIFAPLIILAVPLYDLIVVVMLRLARGRSPFVGDTGHLSHRLVARGMSRRTAVLCIYLITAATSVAAILLPHVDSMFPAILIFGQTLLILGVVMLLEQHPIQTQASTPPTPQPRSSTRE